MHCLSLGAAALMLAAAMPLAAQQQPATGSQKREASEENEHTVPAQQVPAPVRDAFRRAYPNATVVKYSTEQENGRTIYEVESREGSVHRDLNIAADGTILETETQVTTAQLPAAVRTAGQANGGHIDLAEMTVVGRDTTYELRIHGRRGEMKLTKDGRPLPATHN